MSTTQASKATRNAKRHYFIAFIYTHHKPVGEVLRNIGNKWGSTNGIPASWIERAKQEQAQRFYCGGKLMPEHKARLRALLPPKLAEKRIAELELTPNIFEGAKDAGAPIKTVKGHFATVGYKQGVKGGLVPVSQIGNLWPHQGQAHTRSDRRDRDARALVRAQKRAIRESEKNLSTWSKAS